MKLCEDHFCGKPLPELALWIQQDWNDLLNLPLQILALFICSCEGTCLTCWRILWPPTLWTFHFPPFLEEGKGFPQMPESQTIFCMPLPSGSTPPPPNTCTCRHFLNRCAHLPGTTAKPAVITCVKTRVQGITEGNRAIYKLLTDCFKGCGSCQM